MSSLRTYRVKRRFDITEEPKGKISHKGRQAFVVQKHAAGRLHYDLRLELDGVMKSWAVTRGPSMVAGEKRLAVQVEDHPVEYNKFEGTIPEGEYGAGAVMIWDRGTWKPQTDPNNGLKKGHLSFTLDGEKLHGGWHLVRMRHRPNEKRDNWLLIKQHDAAERRALDQDILEEMPRSVVTGRSLDEIAAGDLKKKNTTKKHGRKISAPSLPKVSLRPSTRSIGTNITDAPKAAIPAFVAPSLATSATTAPEGSGWLHELKFDGYRLQARLSNGKVQLMTRRGLNWTSKFPSLAAAIANIPHKAALIDGEAVVEDSDGVSRFSLLQQALKAGDDKHIVFYAFDLMHLDGRDLRGFPLFKRKRTLGNLLDHASQHGTVRFSDSILGAGPALLEKACEIGLEGIISKRTNAPYRSGRGHDWIKTKCSNQQEFVVAGFSPSTADARAIGALVLAFYEKGKLQYAGRTGTGFSFDVARALYRKLNALTVKKSPFDTVPKEERGARGPIWVDPRMVVEIDFRGWTHGNRVRQASFQGEREDKPARKVEREAKTVAAIHTPAVVKKRSGLAGKRPHKQRSNAAPTRKSKGTVQHVKLTHPNRVYWQDGNITKQDLADYYTQVWPWMKPHLIERPIALVRCPEGMDAGDCFFQKHATSGVSTEHLHLVPEKGDRIISVNNLDGLISLVQAGALEIHIRGTTIDHREEADRLVFDLDPGPGVDWKDIVAAARDLRNYLDDIKLKTFIKTSGGKGLHVILPIEPTSWDRAKDFVRTVAEVLEANNPDRYVSTAAKVKRHNRIFIDYLRNSREATAIAPYSTRARPGAPISVPIEWSELTSLKSADQYTLTNVLHRLTRISSDPWDVISKVKQALPASSEMSRGAKNRKR